MLRLAHIRLLLLLSVSALVVGCAPSADDGNESAEPSSSVYTAPAPSADAAPAEEVAAMPDEPEPLTARPPIPSDQPDAGDAPQLAAAPQAAAAGKQEPREAAATKAALPAAAPGGATPKYLEGVPLIPREVLFGNPDKARARISHDGQRLAYLAPVEGVLNIWEGPLDDVNAAKPITNDRNRGIRAYFWAYTNRHIIYTQDKGGDEDWHVYAVDLESGETRDLTPIDGVNAQIEQVSHRQPETILIGLNDRDPQVHDIYRVNILTGERELVEKNEEGFTGYLIDEDYQVRMASRFKPDGSIEIVEPDGQDGWKEFLVIADEDTMTTSPMGFDKAGTTLYLMDSRGRDTGALVTVDLKTGEQKLIASDDRADLDDLLAHPTENTIEAVAFNYTRKQWQIIDQSVADDLEYLKGVADGEFEITGRTLDDKIWTVAYIMDNGPVRFYVYHREPEKKVEFLFTSRDDLAEQPLVKMHDVVIEARDGLPLVSYLTLPPNTDDDGDARPSQPLPLVLDVHGGPWARDSWGYNPSAQLYANRGYAVLSVNFRGSTGFGKKFVNAANREWAGKMHDDLVDAVVWAIDQGIADSKRVCIMGGSYGGYATLVGLTFTPELFACGVDVVGPSNLLTLLSTVPPYWQPAIQMFKTRVGDHETTEGKAFLEERSPLNYVERIQRPLLIGQGANDPRVKQSEADQIVESMKAKNIPVTYVLFPDEGHGFARPENSLAFNAVTEVFLSQHLGGRYEAIGDAFEGSSITVPTGAKDLPGLPEALKEHTAEIRK